MFASYNGILNVVRWGEIFWNSNFFDRILLKWDKFFFFFFEEYSLLHFNLKRLGVDYDAEYTWTCEHPHE